MFPACTQFLTEVHILSDVTISLYCKITLEDARYILKDSSLAGIYKAVPNFPILIWPRAHASWILNYSAISNEGCFELKYLIDALQSPIMLRLW